MVVGDVVCDDDRGADADPDDQKRPWSNAVYGRSNVSPDEGGWSNGGSNGKGAAERRPRWPGPGATTQGRAADQARWGGRRADDRPMPVRLVTPADVAARRYRISDVVRLRLCVCERVDA